MSSLGTREVRVHIADPDFRARGCALKFTLSYEGRLRTGSGKGSDGSSNADRKQALREYFHPQLKRLWETNQFLKEWVTGDRYAPERMEDHVRHNLGSLGGVEFVALVTKPICVECWLDFRILRPTTFRDNRQDIDNQVKVLVDGLRKPRDVAEMGSRHTAPSPLYVLLADDALITKLTSTQDELLQPIHGGDQIESKDVRVLIDVHIRPQLPHADNFLFYSADTATWDHRYDKGIPENLSGMSDGQLKAVATQCIYRIKALAESFEKWNSHRFSQRDEDWDASTKRLLEDSSSQKAIWQNELWPKALAIREELCIRVHGEPPWPSNERTVAIEHGMLAGPHPLADAAAHLELLVRRLS